MSDQLSPQISSEETADEPDKDDGMVFWIRQEHENVKILIFCLKIRLKHYFKT